ncbi:MAG: M48 family metallopeptidase [Bacteroidales bacterium]|nr:M48 family metallopeptidase [Bacteroidales bacterium]
MTKYLALDGVGDIKLTKNARCRSLKITVRPLQGVRVLIPPPVSYEEAERFVYMKKEWIRKTISRMQHIENNYTHFNENSAFQTREHQLKLLKHPERTIKTIIKNRVIYVFYPYYADISDTRIQKCIRKAITEAWRIEAKAFLPGRVRELALRFGFKYNRVYIKNAGTRWGSCSSANNINLNVQLMRLPQHLTDYVILHELAHTIHKNHGKNFWILLEKVTGNAKGLDKQLKKFNLNIW